jgi:hypothetical protein
LCPAYYCVQHLVSSILLCPTPCVQHITVSNTLCPAYYCVQHLVSSILLCPTPCVQLITVSNTLCPANYCVQHLVSSILLCPTPCVQLITVSMHCTLVQLSFINFQLDSINSCTADCTTGASFTDHN